ncbi:kelch-like protein 15 [Amphiura filiformis]|uniref:kelch-like protein 15 n=1 Tax=Amphiura filiformis TaxID=82378 RepID=UPI003B21CEBB
MARMEQDQCVKQMGDPSHLSHLSSGLNQLRHQAAFCDVTIIVGDQRFPAHKAVLSCASEYFQGMFTSGFQESTMSEITVPGTEESFARILDFAYTGNFTLSLRTVVGILNMACYMVLTKAIEFMCGVPERCQR